MSWSDYTAGIKPSLKIKAGHPPIDVPLFSSITLEGGYIDLSRKRLVIAKMVS